MRRPSYAVWWSPDDDAYLATETGRPAGTVHGSTPTEALQEAIEVAREWDDAGFTAFAAEDWSAERIRDLRRSLALTQREFAQLLNVSLSTVRSWEQGQRVPVGPTTRLLDLVMAAPGLARRWQQPMATPAAVQ